LLGPFPCTLADFIFFFSLFFCRVVSVVNFCSGCVNPSLNSEGHRATSVSFFTLGDEAPIFLFLSVEGDLVDAPPKSLRGVWLPYGRKALAQPSFPFPPILVSPGNRVTNEVGTPFLGGLPLCLLFLETVPSRGDGDIFGFMSRFQNQQVFLHRNRLFTPTPLPPQLILSRSGPPLSY